MLEIPHRLQGDGDREMCMFMKDAADKKKAKALVMEGENKVDGMAKIITLDKLRTDYKRFEQKRELLATYDMFLADDRILPMLCKELGKTFFSRKKQPVAIQVTRPAALKSYVERARDSTYMFVSSGTCISITVGTTAMTKEELTANIMAVAPAAIAHVPKKWKNIQAIAVKTSTSDALPVFSKLPFSEMAIDAARADDEAKAAAAAEETKAEEPKEAAPTKKAAKVTRRLNGGTETTRTTADRSPHTTSAHR
jgi:ribosome biogenesis protein UTP30